MDSTLVRGFDGVRGHRAQLDAGAASGARLGRGGGSTARPGAPAAGGVVLLRGFALDAALAAALVAVLVALMAG